MVRAYLITTFIMTLDVLNWYDFMFVYSLSKRISSKASTPGYSKLNKSLNLSHENPAAPNVSRTIKGNWRWYSKFTRKSTTCFLWAECWWAEQMGLSLIKHSLFLLRLYQEKWMSRRHLFVSRSSFSFLPRPDENISVLPTYSGTRKWTELFTAIVKMVSFDWF